MNRVRVYTEDTGGDGIEVVREIARRTLSLLGRSEVGVHPPLDQEHRAHGTLARWRAKTGGGERARRLLINAIHTDAALGYAVLVHVDADVPWSGRATGSRNVEDLEDLLSQVRDPRAGGMVPYAAIEAWLYRALPDAERLPSWVQDPSALDDELRPKDCLPAIRSARNLEFARQFPTRRTQALGLSYAAFVAGFVVLLDAA